MRSFHTHTSMRSGACIPKKDLRCLSMRLARKLRPAAHLLLTLVRKQLLTRELNHDLAAYATFDGSLMQQHLYGTLGIC